MVEQLGGIEVVSNNAGVELPDGPSVAATTDAEWQRVLDVNVTGMFRVCRAALAQLGPTASIVNMGSINSLIAWPNDAAYTASKGAVLQLTRALALEVAGRQVRVNCVCPGIIDTPLNDQFLDRAPDREALLREYEELSPMHRTGTPREVAECVVFWPPTRRRSSPGRHSLSTAAPRLADGFRQGSGGTLSSCARCSPPLGFSPWA